MKNFKKVILLLFMVIMVSGCVKVETNMKISMTKKMDFEIFMSLDKNMLEGNDVYKDELLDDKQKEELKSKGFEVKAYNDNNQIGNIITKKFDNIDYLSSDLDVNFDLESVIEDDLSTAYIFKVEKDFLANKYYAKYDLASNSDFDIDLIDLKFKVTLPYEALDNNATEVIDNGKQLIWDLQKINEPIEFTFKIYNMQNVLAIILLVIIITLILLYCILAIIKKIKEKQEPKDHNKKVERVKKEKKNNKKEVKDAPRFIMPQDMDKIDENK